MRKTSASFHSRKRLRQKYAVPIFKELLSWLKLQRTLAIPESKLGKAITYTLNQWHYITAYVRHGRAEIDTNWVENESRPSAIGKKNWLFVNNENSGAISAFWYSLIQSALLNGLNPKTYIHFLLCNLPKLRKKEILVATLLPHTIDKNILNDFSNEQLNCARRLFNSSA
jgi:transposase